MIWPCHFQLNQSFQIDYSLSQSEAPVRVHQFENPPGANFEFGPMRAQKLADLLIMTEMHRLKTIVSNIKCDSDFISRKKSIRKYPPTLKLPRHFLLGHYFLCEYKNYYFSRKKVLIVLVMITLIFAKIICIIWKIRISELA